MRRELAIALRARVTWIVAALAALLVGHGFVLSVDLFSASSRSALANTLQARGMDPLAGVVRPTLGGLGLALVLLGPLVAARTLSLEKERRTYGALCLAVGSPARVIAAKAIAAALGVALMLVAPIVLFFAYRLAGGHLDLLETAVACMGEGLRMAVIVAASLAAAAWTRTLAQAATLGIALSLTSWAIDAADGFAALAWLGGGSAWSIERQLLPFGKGIVPNGGCLWLLTAAAGAFLLACVGGSFEQSAWRKAGRGAGVLLGAALLMAGAARIRRAHDWTEETRASLPSLVVGRLRQIRAPIELDVYLDRDDSRRRQLESDVLEKLTLARPDIVVRTPLDSVKEVQEGRRDDAYGRIVIRTDGGVRETRSTSRREIVTLICESAGTPLPDWSQAQYPGFPAVIDGPRRGLLVALAYAGLPIALVVVGLCLSQRRTSR
jgi:hypothetical protein